jgi:hypothetical protein
MISWAKIYLAPAPVRWRGVDGIAWRSGLFAGQQ